MLNLIFPHPPPPNPYEAQMAEMAECCEQYRKALEMIRDYSSDLNAIALASNVLMGLKIDFAFISYSNSQRQQ